MNSAVIKEILKVMENDIGKNTKDDEEFNNLVNEFNEVREEYIKDLQTLRSKYLSQFCSILSKIHYLLNE